MPEHPFGFLQYVPMTCTSLLASTNDLPRHHKMTSNTHKKLFIIYTYLIRTSLALLYFCSLHMNRCISCVTFEGKKTKQFRHIRSRGNICNNCDAHLKSHNLVPDMEIELCGLVWRSRCIPSCVVNKIDRGKKYREPYHANMLTTQQSVQNQCCQIEIEKYIEFEYKMKILMGKDSNEITMQLQAKPSRAWIASAHIPQVKSPSSLSILFKLLK